MPMSILTKRTKQTRSSDDITLQILAPSNTATRTSKVVEPQAKVTATYEFVRRHLPTLRLLNFVRQSARTYVSSLESYFVKSPSLYGTRL
jgi:hypothetical protein